MKTLTAQHHQNAADYEGAAPKPFGTLHERMKFLVEVLEKHRGHREGEFDDKFRGLSTAIFDLQTEVKFHAAEKPSLAARPMGRKK
jgi:hypothetical protein